MSIRIQLGNTPLTSAATVLRWGLSQPRSGPILLAMKNKRAVGLFFVISGLALALSARGAEPTAFELAKEANRYVGEQAKDKIVQIRSEKSVGSMSPNIWYVVIYDPT